MMSERLGDLGSILFVLQYPGESIRGPLFFINSSKTSQCSAHVVQGIRLHKPPKMKPWNYGGGYGMYGIILCGAEGGHREHTGGYRKVPNALPFLYYSTHCSRYDFLVGTRMTSLHHHHQQQQQQPRTRRYALTTLSGLYVGE